MSLATLVAHAAEPAQEFDVVVERYVAEGLRSNLALQGETLEVDKATQALAAARARFFPEVSLQARYSRSDGGREFTIPVGTALNPVYATLNELLIAQGQAPRFAATDDIAVPFLRREEQDTRVIVRQPLYAPAIPAAVRVQRALLDASSFNRMAVARALRRDITIGYLDWLKARSAVDIVSASQVSAAREPARQRIAVRQRQSHGRPGAAREGRAAGRRPAAARNREPRDSGAELLQLPAQPRAARSDRTCCAAGGNVAIVEPAAAIVDGRTGSTAGDRSRGTAAASGGRTGQCCA